MPNNQHNPAQLEETIQQLDPDSMRMHLINSARKFKSNWVELGEFLTKAAAEKAYEEWGYKKFEDYCRLEIKIKKATAMKLTNAYFFISQEEPEFFKNQNNSKFPDIDTIGVLQRAKQDEDCSEEMYDELRDAALVRGQAAATVAKKYKDLGNINAGITENDTSLEQSYALVTRLKNKLAPLPDFPEKFKQYLQEMEEYLQPASPEDED
ncbi:MAG: hypothetical protein HOD92_04960 [Deltaproteobacteria bacterium]|jgi:hypothetical protein|nr:hypothetical protein [Deltaproteobacteria bacterium]MBT4527706.1 hypothetical protein [Deltaproteobacteria bacterium]